MIFYFVYIISIKMYISYNIYVNTYIFLYLMLFSVNIHIGTIIIIHKHLISYFTNNKILLYKQNPTQQKIRLYFIPSTREIKSFFL